MNTTDMTALQLAQQIRTKKISVQEACDITAKNIQKYDSCLNSYITQISSDTLRCQSRKIQADISAGKLDASPLAGVPMGLKDNLCTKGILTTCASHMLNNFIPSYSATSVQRLTDAGSLLTGKLNMDEFAMGSTTETSCFGPVKNPWDLRRTAGGSSGGAAAAVSAGEAFYALGSDTGGSIRQPCAWCGLTGLKPTYGSVSRYGLIAYASSFDQIGPIAKDALDCAAVLSVIGGLDSKDSTSLTLPPVRLNFVRTFSVKGVQIGIPLNFMKDGLSPEIQQVWEETIRQYEHCGAHITPFELPDISFALPAYYIIACAQAASNLARYDGIRYGKRCENPNNLHELYLQTRSEGFGREVKLRILLGNFVLSAGYYDAYYKKALRAAAYLRKIFHHTFQRFDFLLFPVSPNMPPFLSENSEDSLAMYRQDCYTVPANLCRLPAAAFPCGFSQGLPVGMQLMGAPLSEERLLGAIHAFQRETDYHFKRPPLQKLSRRKAEMKIHEINSYS